MEIDPEIDFKSNSVEGRVGKGQKRVCVERCAGIHNY